MAISGNQIRAARSLAGVGQHELAEAANISVNTIRNVEGRGKEAVRVQLQTMDNIRAALRDLGVALTESDDGLLGVQQIPPLEKRFARPLAVKGRLAHRAK